MGKNNHNNYNYNYSGVLSSEESKQKNFLDVNHRPPASSKSTKGAYLISKTTILIMTVCILAILLAAIAATYFLTSTLVNGSETSCGDFADQKVSQLVKLPESFNRLPRNVLPSYYRIKLLPNVSHDGNGTTGEVSINITCIETSNNITLNVNEIDIDKNETIVCKHINENVCEPLKITRQLYNVESQSYAIILEENLIKNQNYIIKLKFNYTLNDFLQGFYRSVYIDEKTGDYRYVAATQFSPTDARRAFPCFDEPDKKAQFEIILGRDARKHITLSNMPIRESNYIPSMDGWVWDHYEVTPKMPTYSVAIVISDLKPLNGSALKEAEGVSKLKFIPSTQEKSVEDYSIEEDPNKQRRNVKYKLMIWARANSIPQTYYVYQLAPKVVSFYEEYFGIDYPLPKLDLVALPDFGYDAMENFGLIIFRESAMLYNPQVTTLSTKEYIAMILSHEVAHQWFGNLVTPKWWKDVWLKEGFSNYLSYLSVNQAEKSWNIIDHFVNDIIYYVYDTDQLSSSHPLSSQVEQTSAIREMFDQISYSKGAALLRMMRHFLTEDIFKKGLTNFLNTFAYDNAEQNEFWESYENISGITEKLPENTTLKEVMDTWTLQSGFPIITVVRDYTLKLVNISQDRFLISGSSNETSLWYIPITFTTQSKADFNNTLPDFWLTEKSISLNVTEWSSLDWVLANVQNTGYYRVNYDEQNWKLLVQNFKKLSPLTRAQLIEDSANIARAGLIRYDFFLSMLTLLNPNESDLLAWEVAAKNLAYLNNMLVSTPIYGDFRRFLVSLLEKFKNKIDFTEDPKDSHALFKLRPIILKLMCQLREESCLRKAQMKFRTWMQESSANMNSIPPNLRYIVYCTTLREGGTLEWEFALEQYINSNVVADKEVILDSLGCASESWLLARLLNASISGNIEFKKQNAGRVFATIAQNPLGHHIAYKFLRNNWNQINTYCGEAFNVVNGMIMSLHYFLNNQFDLEEINIFKKLVNSTTASNAFNFLTENVKSNIRWMETNFENINGWLNWLDNENRIRNYEAY